MPFEREETIRNPRRSTSKAPAKELWPTGPVSLSAGSEPALPSLRLAPSPAAPPTAVHARLPPLSDLPCTTTTRLLPAKYSESVLTRIADNDADLQLIFSLDNATNDRLLTEGDQRLGITARELVFAVPHYRIINAAFTHPHPQGARFSTPYRGAWYAGLELATAKAEVLFHREIQFAEIGWQQPEELDYDEYTADFTGCFHDLRAAAFAHGDPSPCMQPGSTSGGTPSLAVVGRGASGVLEIWAAEMPPSAAEFADCLDKNSYVASQELAIHLLEAGSLGILYPSARRPNGNCIACFRPSLVTNVRKRDLYCLRWYPDRPASFLRKVRVPATSEAPPVAGRDALGNADPDPADLGPAPDPVP